MIIIRKLYLILLFSLILFLGIGIASASENNTDTGDIGNLIDECEDKGTIQLDEKTYELNPENETHLYLNKSISIEGIHEKTIIDGKNSTLFLDVEKEPEPDYNEPIIIAEDLYGIKNTGKHIIFKNITFKDLNLISRHKMDFLDCKFINTNFTSKELNNTFDNCVFNESKIELNLYQSHIYYSKIINCTFYNSTVTSENNFFICTLGVSIFMQNNLDLINSSLNNSEISLSYYNINMNNLKFRNSNLKGWSNRINIDNASFDGHAIDLEYSYINSEQAILNNCELKFQGGDYSKGSEVILKNTATCNSTFEFIPHIDSEKSIFIVENSTAENCRIKATETNIKSNNSNFHKTTIESHSSDLNIYNSNFYNNGTLSDTIIIYLNSIMNTSNVIENSYLINDTGKYEIKNEDINFDTCYRVSFNKNITYYLNDSITFNVRDCFGNPVQNVKLFIENPNEPYTSFVFTDRNGNAKYTLNTIGDLSLNVYYFDDEFLYNSKRYSIQVNLTVKPIITDMKLIKDFEFNKYSKINSLLEVKMICNSTCDLSDRIVIFKVFTGKTYKTYRETADSNGYVVFEIPTKLDAGVHKIQVIVKKIMKTTSIKIDKARTIVKAPQVTNKLKKSKYFKVTIKNKETKRMLSNVKVKIKVFTGKKFKKYIVKTDKKGIAKINTKNLKTGTHKVVISSGNKNYGISKKSLIKIKK